MSGDYVRVKFVNQSKQVIRLFMKTSDGSEIIVTDIEVGEISHQISPINATWVARIMYDANGGKSMMVDAEIVREQKIQVPQSFTLWAMDGFDFFPLITYKPDPRAEVKESRRQIQKLTMTMDWTIEVGKENLAVVITEEGLSDWIKGGQVMPPYGLLPTEE